MRALIQRSLKSSVCVKEEGEYREISSIEKGLVVLLGVEDDDGDEHMMKLCDKIEKLRIFEDDEGKMNLSVKDVGGDLLIVSQFTLYADCKKGNRPSFVGAGDYKYADKMYQKMVEEMRKRGFKVGTGQFGADMLVNIQNLGPVTIWLDTDELMKK